MRVLIACEFSGIVREAFRARGHDAWSCDYEPTEQGEHHMQTNVMNVINQDWDLMIAHPPCTYLANSGAKHLYKDGKKANGRDEKRWDELYEAAKFFRHLLHSRIPRICIENPIQHAHARNLIGVRQSQIIQPWQFGHGEIKATCLWLKYLPELQPTRIVDGRAPRVHHESPGPDRWKNRSRTLQGIADAMARQWG